MTRFGDFTIHAHVGESAVADAVVASHDSLGGPFYVKQFTRLPKDRVRDLIKRADRLVGVKSPHLLEHLGHGIVDDIPFTVSPIIEGIDLSAFIASLKERRVSLGLDLLLFLTRELALAVKMLHSLPADASGIPLTHGDVSAPHVRLCRDGRVLLTSIVTPRGPNAGQPSQPVWDGAGVSATVYDLLPLLRPGVTRPPLPGPLERVVRRSLGIVPAADAIPPSQLVEHLDEAALMLKANPDREAFARMATRTIDAIHKQMEAEQNPPLKPGVIPIQAAAADALPVLEPINLESIAELSPESMEGEAEARVEIVSVPPQAASMAPAPSPPPQVSPPRAEASERPVRNEQTNDGAPSGSGVSEEASAFDAAEPFSAVTAPFPARSHPALDAPQSGEASAPPKAATADTASARTQARASGVTGAPTDEVTFPFTSPAAVDDNPPAPDSIAAPFPPLDRHETSVDMRDPTRSTLGGVTTTGPDQSAILTDENEALAPPPAQAALDEPSFDSLPELDTSEIMEIPSVPPPMADDDEGSFSSPEPASSRSKTGVTAIPRGLFADPPDEAVNLGGPREKTHVTRADDDTDPGRAADASSLSSDEGHEEGFIEEKTLPNLDLNPDTDTEQGAPKSETTTSASEAAESAPKLGRAVEALLKRNLVTEAHVKTALAAQRERGGRVVEILVQLQAATDEKVADVLAEAALRPRITAEGLRDQLPDADVCRKLPQTYAQNRRLLPLGTSEGTLTLAVVDPFAADDIEEIRKLLRADAVAVKVATRAALTEAIAEAYRRAGMQRANGSSEVTQGIMLCCRNDSLSERIGQRLVMEGFSIELADTSSAARAALENRIAHAVVCDTQLDGDEDAALLRFARGNERLEDTPFFVYGPEDDALEARVLDLGADDYFAIPFNLDVLVKKLRRAISKTAAKTDALLQQQARKAVRPKKKSEKGSLLDEAPPVEAPLSVPRMVTMVGAVPGLEKLRDLPDLSDVGDPGPAAPPPTMDASDPFAPPPSTGGSDMMGEPTGVMGTLRQMSVSEIVQSLELGRKSARVELVPSYGERGALAFTDGQVVYAECNDLRGEDAFYVLAGQQEGFFRIHYGVEPEEKNINKPSMFLLLEAARKADEESEGVEP